MLQTKMFAEWSKNAWNTLHLQLSNNGISFNKLADFIELVVEERM